MATETTPPRLSEQEIRVQVLGLLANETPQ
jgi:hypothetical protein